MNERAGIKKIIEKMKRVAKLRNNAELGKILDGISSQAISSAISSEKIPFRWFEIFEERFGVTREDLELGTTAVRSALDQHYDLAGERRGGSEEEELHAQENDDLPEEIAIEQTRYIIQSKTIYRQALLSNIRAFYQGVKGDEKVQGIDAKMELMQQKHDADMEELKEMLRSLGGSVAVKKERRQA